MTKRCGWSVGKDLALGNALMMAYHDKEWGVPVHDDRKLFEYMVLDAFQAGLSWSTILNKRENFRKAFDNFEAERIARYNSRRVEKLLKDVGIVRNRLKVQAAVTNARAFLEIQEEVGSFDRFIWQFVDGVPKQNAWKTMRQIPASTKESDRMSKALKENGFKFVGSTICYAFMQAAGMVNDHEVNCYRYGEIKRLGSRRRRTRQQK
jgi:DNA-3-methyladenine glycosylase I